MSTSQSGPMILAIGSLDDFLHVYKDDRELLADSGIGAGPSGSAGALEFFDSRGYRLAGIYDQRWNLVRLTPTAESPNPAAVQERVQNVIDHMRNAVQDNPGEASLHGMTVDEVLELFPRLDGSTDLDAALRIFLAEAEHGHVLVAAHGGGDERPNNRRHNFLHRLGWKHR